MTEGSIEDVLGNLSHEGHVESTGAFSLSIAKAREKLGAFGQISPETASLKIAQAFCALGCSKLEIHSKIGAWIFIGYGGKSLEAAEVRDHIVGLALGRGAGPEQELARALLGCAQWDLVSASWSGRETTNFLGLSSRQVTVNPDAQVLEMTFKFETAPFFCKALWKERLFFSPVEIWLDNKRLNDGRRSEPEPDSFGLTCWFESICQVGDKPSLAIQDIGDCRLQQQSDAQTVVKSDSQTLVKRAFPQQLQAGSACGDCYLRIRPGFKDPWDEPRLPTTVTPVVNGCTLDSIEFKGLPVGLEIAFGADGLSTDLTTFGLVQSEEARKRVTCGVKLQLAAMNDFSNCLQHPTVFSHVPQGGLATMAQFGSISISVLGIGSTAFMAFVSVSGPGMVASVGLAFLGAMMWNHAKPSQITADFKARQLANATACTDELRQAIKQLVSL